METSLPSLFAQVFDEPVVSIDAIKAHAGNRRLYRLKGKTKSVVGVLDSDLLEANAFIKLTEHFTAHGLPVPHIYIQGPSQNEVLIEDLGDTTLLDLLLAKRTTDNHFPVEIERLYLAAVKMLPKFQIVAGKSVDFSVCYPKKQFDESSMIGDMNYFVTEYLSRTKIAYVADEMEADFKNLSAFLLKADRHYFMYRDFQARNIMVQNGDLRFIDYQGGRRGPLHYDLVSLLGQSRADIPNDARARLTEAYLIALQEHEEVDVSLFKAQIQGFKLIRLLQVLGTYGKFGIGERKTYFLESIPYALHNISSMIEEGPAPISLPTLMKVLAELVKPENKIITD